MKTPGLPHVGFALAVILVSAASSAAAQPQTPGMDGALKGLYETFLQKALGDVPYGQMKARLTDSLARMASFPAQMAAELQSAVKRGLGLLKGTLGRLPVAALVAEMQTRFLGAKTGGNREALRLCMRALEAQGKRVPLLPPRPKGRKAAEHRAYARKAAEVESQQAQLCAKEMAAQKKALDQVQPLDADPEMIKARITAQKDQLQTLGLGALQMLTSLPEQLKQKVKDLLWMPLDSPSSTANDTKIRAFFDTELTSILELLKNVKLGGFKPSSVLPEAEYAKYLSQASDVITTLATPGVRWFQFIRTKLKAALRIVIKYALTAIADANKRRLAIEADLKKLLGLGQIPKWLLDTAENLATTLGQVVGGLGTYVLNLQPKTKEVVVTAIDTIASTADSLDEAMKTAVEMGSAFGGDLERAADEGRDVLARARTLVKCASPPREPNEDFKNACSGVPRGFLALKNALARVDKFGAAKLDLATRDAQSLARELKVLVSAIENQQANTLKRENVALAIEQILDAVRTAFVTFMTPPLQQVASLLNMLLVPPLHTLAAGVKEVIALIPWVGGPGAVLWDVVSMLAIPIIVQIPAAVVIPLSLDILGEEISDLKRQFMEIWDAPNGPTLFEQAQNAIKVFAERFKVLKAGLDGLRQGLNEGAAAMFKGPIATLLMAKLPHGLGQVLVAGVEKGLITAFPANGQFDLNPVKITVAVLKAIKAPLLKTLLSVTRGGPSYISDEGVSRFATYLVAVANSPGASNAYDSLVQDVEVKNNFSALFQMNVIRRALGDLVNGTAGLTVDFLLGELLARGVTLPACAATLKGGIVNVIRHGLVPLIKGEGNDVATLFQPGGLKAVIPLLVRMAMEKPKTGQGEAPLVQFFVCAAEKNLSPQLRVKWNTKWKRLVIAALYAGAGLVGSQENMTHVLKKGLPGLMGAVFQIGGPLLAGLLAQELADPPLQQELTGAFAAVGETIASGAFMHAFADKGLQGVLSHLAQLPPVKSALLGSIARRLADTDLVPELEAGYALTLRALSLPTGLSSASFRPLLYPAARYAFRKAAKWGAFGASLARPRIKRYLLRFLRGLKPFGGAFDGVRLFETSVLPKLDAWTDASFNKLASAALPCSALINEHTQGWMGKLATCLVSAGSVATTKVPTRVPQGTGKPRR